MNTTKIWHVAVKTDSNFRWQGIFAFEPTLLDVESAVHGAIIAADLKCKRNRPPDESLQEYWECLKRVREVLLQASDLSDYSNWHSVMNGRVEVGTIYVWGDKLYTESI
jgi:hypothetical protein